MFNIKKFIKDTGGDAVVEATFLFPIMILIFFALVLLSMYLPARASLQRATQQAASVVADEKSDTWVLYDDAALSYGWKTDLPGVYMSVFQKFLTAEDEEKIENIVRSTDAAQFITPPGSLDVSCSTVNYVIYKEITVTAVRTIPMPPALSFVGIPEEIIITVTSTATVQNSDEFIRNIDIITDVIGYFGLDISRMGELFSAVNIFK
ncbi:MAG: pilus assembly protein [Oscillospiraceae bacterium]|nr:pilus assembly protein [Oscillospiraceae bacterium]